MDISVIIPLYNKGAKVKRAIDSVLSQRWNGKFEVIVIDDGSSDDSAKYVKSYQDERVHYFYKTNGGVSSARNRGIQEANGKWILFLDADDELLPGALDKYEILVKEYPEASVLVQKQNLYNSKGLIQKIIWGFKSSYITRFPFLTIWLNLCFPCPRNFCFKKKLCKQSGEFDTRMSFWEDYEFTSRIIKRTKMAFSSYCGAKYNQESTGLSGTQHSLQKEMAYYIPEILAKGDTSFWERALLYENIEQEIAWWQGHPEELAFYRDMQRKHFAWYHKHLHWLRQQLKRHGWI